MSVSSLLKYRPGNSQLELVMLGDVIDSARQAELKSKMPEYGLYHCNLLFLQGPDSRQAIKGQFDELNTGVKVNNASIKNLYLMSDSLWKELDKVRWQDSINVQLARAVKVIDTNLNHLSVRRYFSFNPSKNMNDTLWDVSASFRGVFPKVPRTRLDSVFKAHLRSDYIKLSLE